MENIVYKKFNDLYLCPCCGYPTISERVVYEICSLCYWEDDGQDEHNADVITGGPNSDYSLSQARRNFRKYYTMYEPTDKDNYEKTTVQKNYLGKVIFDKVPLKKQIIAMYKNLVELRYEKEQHQLLKEILLLEKKLK